MTEARPIPHEREANQKPEFIRMLENRWSQGLFVCVGLDPNLGQIPESVRRDLQHRPDEIIFRFNKALIDATSDLVSAYKPNSAFYEQYGRDGYLALDRTMRYLKVRHPEIPIILDAKRGDIGSTNDGYARAAFDELKADAITVHPYLGKNAMKPFLDRKDKGVIVLAKTSNQGAEEFQDLFVDPGRKPQYLQVAFNVSHDWNYNGNCGLVIGATYPEDLKSVRLVAPTLPILIPGVGAQGGDLEKSVKNGVDEKNQGIIINASRSIIYASSTEDFDQRAREETQRLTEEINRVRLANE
jgi:orotidine-5'-phosphate decarboxylase